MKSKKKPVRTYTRMVTSGSFRLKESDQALWIEAASKADESLSQFLRSALRERAKKVLSHEPGRLRNSRQPRSFAN